MRLINLCPHPILIRRNHNCRIEIPESGEVARLQFSTDFLRMAGDIPVHERRVLKVNGLPEEKKGVLYIVSAMLQQHLDRDDLISPDRYSCYTDDDGRIIETDRLVRIRKE